MNKMEKALHELAEMDELAAGTSPIHGLCAPAKLLTTIAYIAVVLSFGKYQLSGLIVTVLYPVLLFQLSGVSVGSFFYKLRIVLPLVMAVGLFNPIFDRQILLRIGSVGVSGGVISMLTLMMKGVFCLMASYLLMATTPIDVLCAALRKFHVPATLVTLLLLTYRYIGVMTEELAVMTEAYALGTIDPETLTNTTANCRDKFYDDKFGVFTYWAGQWASNLKNNLEIHNKDGELVAIEPIEEVGAYIDRVSGCWCISAACENPEGVYTWLIDSMLDGGDIQFLWTYGVEGVHWSRKAETLYAGTSKEVTYPEGKFHFLDNRETPGSQYKKSMLDPALVFATYQEGYEAPTDVAPENAYSANLFNTHSKSAQLVPGTDA